MSLAKAKFQEISSDKVARELGPEIDVQFNPTTLRLQLGASLPSGTPPGSEVRQSNGSSSATLTMDLVFDTADEGTTSQPVSVREKTAMIEKFVVASPGSKNKEKPPKVRFIWGDFKFDGVVSSISIDFDLFAANGKPLRAKIGVSIQEQNSHYMFLAAGPGADQAGNASRPGQAGIGLGFSASASLGIGVGIGASIGVGGGVGVGIGTSFGASASVGMALDGEALPEFAARVGMDPAAWRGLSGDVSGGFSLEAGTEIGFDVGLSASAGLGASQGVEAGLSAPPEKSFGLEDAENSTTAAGFALSAGGGVSAALNTVQNAKTQDAARATKQEFAMEVAPSPRPKPAAPQQSRSPLAITGLPSLTQQLETASAPPPPRIDTRESTFGFGVPLVPARGEAAMARAALVAGATAVRGKIGAGLPPKSLDPTTPPWEALPAGRAPTSVGRTKSRCGCGGRCRCGCSN